MQPRFTTYRSAATSSTIRKSIWPVALSPDGTVHLGTQSGVCDGAFFS